MLTSDASFPSSASAPATVVTVRPRAAAWLGGAGRLTARARNGWRLGTCPSDCASLDGAERSAHAPRKDTNPIASDTRIGNLPLAVILDACDRMRQAHSRNEPDFAEIADYSA